MAATYDINTIKRHSYVATFGTTVIAPLSSSPKIENDRKIVESLIYENGGHEAVASHLVRNAATVTLETKDINTALELLSDFGIGDDVMAESRKQVLSLTPVAEGEKTLIFKNAYLLPELSYVPGMGTDHTAKLVFKALSDTESGKLYTFE